MTGVMHVCGVQVSLLDRALYLHLITCSFTPFTTDKGNIYPEWMVISTLHECCHVILHVTYYIFDVTWRIQVKPPTLCSNAAFQSTVLISELCFLYEPNLIISNNTVCSLCSGLSLNISQCKDRSWNGAILTPL